MKKRVYINFKANEEDRKKLKEIVTFKLNSEIFYVMEDLMLGFLEDWKTEEGKKLLFAKYFNKKYANSKRQGIALPK